MNSSKVNLGPCDFRSSGYLIELSATIPFRLLLCHYMLRTEVIHWIHSFRNRSCLLFKINSLSRWEVINKVRTMSTEAARAGEEGGRFVVNHAFNRSLRYRRVFS